MSAPDRRAMLDRADRTLSLTAATMPRFLGWRARASTGRASRPTTTTPR